MRKRISTRPVVADIRPKEKGMSIAVQLSRLQYNTLLGKDAAVARSVGYVRGEDIAVDSMTFIPPPRADFDPNYKDRTV
jgi:hypothetical protein